MQTQYQTFRQLEDAVKAAHDQQKDVIADTRQLRMLPVKEGGGPILSVQGNGEYDVNDYAHRQIGSRLGIPAQYYDRMLKEDPGLLSANVNTWFTKNPERRMVRTQSRKVRAFLSDRYQRLDNFPIMRKVLLPALKEHASDLVFHSLALTESRMYLKAVLPSVRAEVKVGEIVEAGIEFRNGEIGNCRFEAWPFMYELTCKNGARFETGGFKKLHVGARAEVSDEVYEMLSDDTLRLDDAAFMAKVKDMINATLTQRSFDKLVDRVKEAAQEKITGNPAAAVQVLGDSFGFNDDERGSVLRHLIEGGDLSKWGVSRAVTRAAQDLKSYDRSDEFEGFGGRIIELPKTEWSRLAEAA
jgi:hypothetical protein